MSQKIRFLQIHLAWEKMFGHGVFCGPERTLLVKDLCDRGLLDIKPDAMSPWGFSSKVTDAGKSYV